LLPIDDTSNNTGGISISTGLLKLMKEAANQQPNQQPN
jgi:hypothetical protein